MKVDTDVVRILIEKKYRLIACDDDMMMFASDTDVAVMYETFVRFVKDRVFVEISLDNMSFNGDCTCVFDVNKKWGWEFGIGKTRNNYIA